MSDTQQPMASPLHWPAGQPRTRYRTRWRGKTTVSSATQQVAREVRLLGAAGSTLVVSTNLALRLDGFPRSGQAEPSDPGVAVYFNRKGKRLVFACDRYRTVAENIRAVAMHLAALRGMERWGVGTADQAFAGYAALPAPEAWAWWNDLGLPAKPGTLDELRAAYLSAGKRAHPDVEGGSAAAWARVDAAYRHGMACLEPEAAEARR